jgi:hypothetical protein
MWTRWVYAGGVVWGWRRRRKLVNFIVYPVPSFGITWPNTQRQQPRHGREARVLPTLRLKWLGIVSKIHLYKLPMCWVRQPINNCRTEAFGRVAKRLCVATAAT